MWSHQVDMGTKHQRAEIDRIIEPDELDRLGTNQKEARKIVQSYNFFLSDTAFMSTVGRSLGQFLGPKGKMPSPLPYRSASRINCKPFEKLCTCQSKESA